MTEKMKKHGIEISEEGQHLKIYIPSFSTLIFVYQEDKKDFIKYLKYIHDKYKFNKYSYRANSVIQYGEDEIYLGESFSVKYPKFGNYLELNKIPIILDLLNGSADGDTCIVSIIRKIKKIRGENKWH